MSPKVFQKMRVVGIEDGSFVKGVDEKALLAAVLFKGLKIEDVTFKWITVDGFDATEKAAEILKQWDFQAVMLAGVSFAGFNVIDPLALSDMFQKPIVVVARTKPDNRAVKSALIRHFKDWARRWEVFAKLGPIYEVKVLEGEAPLYFEVVGAKMEWASQLITSFVACGRIPEPLRVARLIARGLS
ncbi:DUF99 family protein [Candidatus Bathyarchaeota archaeon]|nr:DUF99 family protein [Candidatus Bathyarchaeota archaeon]